MAMVLKTLVEENWQLCCTTILTFAEKPKYLGFIYATYVDKKDRYKNSLQQELKIYSDKLDNENIEFYLASNLFVEVGKPTACAYQFINYIEQRS